MSKYFSLTILLFLISLNVIPIHGNEFDIPFRGNKLLSSTEKTFNDYHDYKITGKYTSSGQGNSNGHVSVFLRAEHPTTGDVVYLKNHFKSTSLGETMVEIRADSKYKNMNYELLDGSVSVLDLKKLAVDHHNLNYGPYANCVDYAVSLNSKLGGFTKNDNEAFNRVLMNPRVNIRPMKVDPGFKSRLLELRKRDDKH